MFSSCHERFLYNVCVVLLCSYVSKYSLHWVFIISLSQTLDWSHSVLLTLPHWILFLFLYICSLSSFKICICLYPPRPIYISISLPASVSRMFPSPYRPPRLSLSPSLSTPLGVDDEDDDDDDDNDDDDEDVDIGSNTRFLRMRLRGLLLQHQKTNFSQRKFGVNLNLTAEHLSRREDLGSRSEF